MDPVTPISSENPSVADLQGLATNTPPAVLYSWPMWAIVLASLLSGYVGGISYSLARTQKNWTNR